MTPFLYITKYSMSELLENFNQIKSEISNFKFDEDNYKNLSLNHNNIVDYAINKAKRHFTPKRDVFSFEAHITNDCNLNCFACNHFAPLAPIGTYYDNEKLKKDFTRISELFNKKCSVNLMGGEPLLHPQIEDILEYSSKLFKKVTLFTNGVILFNLIKSNDTKLFTILKEFNIQVRMTKYPIIDYSIISRYLDSQDIKYEFEPFHRDIRGLHCTMDTCGVNLNGTSNQILKFLTCGNGNFTVAFNNSKFYSCPFKATIHLFIDYFSKKYMINIPSPSEDDYIDIYKVKSCDEIIEFVARPTPYCRYCSIDLPDVSNPNNPWDTSKKDITEWINKNDVYSKIMNHYDEVHIKDFLSLYGIIDQQF